jgi:hypothetical protein
VADSAEATGLKWATAASGGGMTLLSTTTLSGASLVVESQRAAGLTWNGGQNMLAGNTANGASILFYNYADTSIAYKTFSFQGRSVSTASPATNTNAGGGTIATSSAITSIQIGMGSGTFTGGTALLYGVL